MLPCLVIVISYTCIYLTVQRQRRKLECHRFVNNKFIINKSNKYLIYSSHPKQSKDQSRKSKEDNRLTVMMLTIFVCFILCFLPLMLANVVDEQTKSNPWFHIFSSVMAWASSVINPFIYAASNRSYRWALFTFPKQFILNQKLWFTELHTTRCLPGWSSGANRWPQCLVEVMCLARIQKTFLQR